jgi:amidase
VTAALWAMSATAALALIRKGEVSPSEILASLRGRIESINPQVNALPTLCFDRAKARATALERMPMADRGVLAGLPIPIKDAYDVAGVRTTYGSPVYADRVAERSDFLVEAIEAAGGIVYAKSNTPEFQAGANTFNEVFGATLNPWNVSRSAAGSSGGAAVAVATGMAFIAQGSDNACSIRYPAAFCGIVGLRPSPGIVPQGPGKLPHQVLSVIGPLARTVADVGLALEGMARFDWRDPLSRPLVAGSYHDAALRPARPARAAYSIDLGVARVSSDVRNVVTEAIGRLVGAGLNVEDEAPDVSRCRDAFLPLRAFQFAALRHNDLLRHRDKLKPEVVWNIEEGLKLGPLDIAAAETARADVRSSVVHLLERYDVLISAAAPVVPYAVEQRYVDEIDGEKQQTYLDWLVLGYAVTVTGCPAISIPCGFTPEGLPVGLQLIGRPYGEAQLLSAAAWCEAVLGASLDSPIDPRGAG